MLAPILVKAFGVEPVLYAAGGLLLLAALRLANLSGPVCDRQTEERLSLGRVTAIVPWVLSERKVGSMMALAILGSLTGLLVTSLGPVYVDSLGADAADTAYVFAPAALGMLLSMGFVPRAARSIGERRTAAIGFVIALAAVLGLGVLAGLRQAPAAMPTGAQLAISSALALPIGFGLTTVTAAVLNYLNRRVPHSHQARVFALQSAVRNGVSIGPMLGVGLLAAAAGLQAVLIAAPLLLLAAGLAVAGESFRWMFGEEGEVDSIVEQPSLPD